MFADEEYDKAAVEFMQIPAILKRKCQLGGKWLPNEIFAERKIKHWMEKARKLGFSKKRPAHHDIILDGAMLKRVVAINPLWELIYLWNGFSQLTPCTLQLMKQSMETILANTPTDEIDTDMALLYLLLGVSVRELGDFDLADMYLQQSMRADDGRSEDRWVLSHCMYEMAALKCFQLLQCTKAPTKKVLLKEAHEWIRKSERQLATPDSVPTDTNGDSDWDSRIHVRCQLLIEKLEDIAKSIADF
jgi:hypothetical protein